jgi:hypothetical protein
MGDFFERGEWDNDVSVYALLYGDLALIPFPYCSMGARLEYFGIVCLSSYQK